MTCMRVFASKAVVVVDEHGRLGQERGVEGSTRRASPSRGRDVEVHVVGAHAESHHMGREVPDRVGDVGVLHELRPVRGARGEVEQRGVGRGGRPVGFEGGRRVGRVGEARPLRRDAVADADAEDAGGDVREPIGERAEGDDRAGSTVFDAVCEIGGGGAGSRSGSTTAPIFVIASITSTARSCC